MDDVVWPPGEKVKLLGGLSRPEVIGFGLALGLFIVGLVAAVPIQAFLLALAIAAWTYLRWGGVPIRTRVMSRLRWWRRRDKVWAAPIRGAAGAPPFLRGVTLRLVTAEDQRGAVCVIESAKDGSYTVLMDITRPSTVFSGSSEHDRGFRAWADVLAGLCVERGTGLTAERIFWTDIHRAADPSAIVAHHRTHGVDGPATADYAAYAAQFGSVSSEHRVVLGVTITRSGRLRAARKAGLKGSVADVMGAAAVVCARGVREEMVRRGFGAPSGFLSPAQVGRLIVEMGDPFEPRRGELSARERFGVADRTGPNSVDVHRHEVAVDHAYHRAFAITWPRTDVAPDWLWLPLSAEGPKFVTTVLEPIAPSVADSDRESLTDRAEGNNQSRQNRKGRVRTIDRRKTAALAAAERAVAAGHTELDGYALIVVSGRNVEDLDRRCLALRGKLTQAGRASARELTGLHDVAFAAALPLGVAVKAAVE